MINKILRLFVKALTVGDKFYLLNRDNLTRPIQMQLCQKEKTFAEFFFFFDIVKSILNFKHLPEKDDPHSCYFRRNTGSEKHGKINV